MMMLSLFLPFFLFQIVNTKKLIPPRPPQLKTSNKFPIFERQLFFTIDPRRHNDDVLMKKIITDNEKIHLLQKLTSNLSIVDKIELIVRNNDKIFPININPDNLLDEWNFDENNN